MASSANRRGTRIALRSLKPEGTMLRLKQRQREIFADKLPDLANIGAGLFVFGQFVGQEPTSAGLLVIGIAIWAAFIALAVAIAGGTQ